MGLRFKVKSTESRVQGLGLYGLRFRVGGAGFRARGLGFGVQGLGFGVYGWG